MIASWGDNEYEYAFVIKTHANMGSSEPIEQTNKFSLKDLSFDELNSIHLTEMDDDRTLFNSLLSS